MRYLLSLILVVMVAVPAAAGEKSSLFKTGKTAPAPVVNERGEEVQTTEANTVANTSLIAVKKAEPRKFKVHDIITVVVREESTSKTTADASQDKSVKLSADLKEWIKFHQNGTMRIIPDAGIAANNPKIDVSAGRNVENEGEANTKDSFLTKIAATVIDVKPNGNLVIEAMSHVEHNEENITLTLTGTVSPTSVTSDNTVASSNVAHLTVTKKTEGVVRDGQKRGWLLKLLDMVSPF